MVGELHNHSFNISNVERSERYIRTAEDVSLKIHSFIPKKSDHPDVLFLPGWITVIEKFYRIIKGLNQLGYPVHYLDFRDKKTSRFHKSKLSYRDFLFDRYISDIESVVTKLSLSDYYIFGSSFGAALTVKFLGNPDIKDQQKPKKSVLMIPAVNLRFHGWQKAFIRTPMALKPMIVKIVEWYLKMNYINPDEPELAYQFSEKMVDVDPRKVQLSAIAIDKEGGFNLQRDVYQINKDVMIVGAENDLMHPERLMKNFAKSIHEATYLNLHSNKFTYAEIMGQIAGNFFAETKFKNFLPPELQRINAHL